MRRKYNMTQWKIIIKTKRIKEQYAVKCNYVFNVNMNGIAKRNVVYVKENTKILKILKY